LILVSAVLCRGSAFPVIRSWGFHVFAGNAAM
jgi:hypothetical protein